MPSPEIAQLLAVLALLVAFIVGVRGFWAWRSINLAAVAARARAVELETSADRLPERVLDWRTTLAAANVPIERALWSLARFDAIADEAPRALRAQRFTLDRLRTHELLDLQRSVRRARRTVALAKRLDALRRTVEG